MATMIRLDGLTGLRRVDPDKAALGAVLADLIEAAECDAALIHAPAPGACFACEDGVHFRIEGGAPLAEDRVSDAVALLDRAEPVLDLLERTLAIALEPGSIVSDFPEAAALIGFRHESLAGTLAVPLNHPARARWESKARALQRRADRTPLILAILLDGPRLPVPEAGSLAAGDLVLFGAQPAATIAACDGPSLRGRFDLASGDFILNPQGAQMAADPQASATSHDFAVPLTLRLPDRMVSAASLAGLQPGTALPLGAVTDGLPVELLVAGRPLARGELVQLGDRFAVLIEERVPLDPGDAATPVATEAEADVAEAQA